MYIIAAYIDMTCISYVIIWNRTSIIWLMHNLCIVLPTDTVTSAMTAINDPVVPVVNDPAECVVVECSDIYKIS